MRGRNKCWGGGEWALDGWGFLAIYKKAEKINTHPPSKGYIPK